MRRTSGSASRVSQLLSVAVTLLAIACNDTTTPTVPAKLAFTIEPAATIAGAPITVAIAVQDAGGRTVTTATNAITIAIGTNPQSGTLAGTTTVAAVNGVATFSNLSINNAASGYTLTATAANLTDATSITFAVAVGAAAKLSFTIQPANTIANTTIPAFRVAVQDAAGNTVTGANNLITLAIGTNPASGALSGQTTANAANGVATFFGTSINNTGSGYTLTATTPNLTGATSAAFNVILGPASKLAFTVQPAITSPGATITPAVTVAIQDVGGNTVTTAANPVTLAIGANPASGTLSGTTTVTPVNGIATFANLSINNAGVGYTLTAAATSLGGATSTAFAIRNPLTFTVVSPGYFHSCGVATGGAAYCWGDNAFGKLGSAGPQTSIAVAVSGGLSFATVSAGRDHSCGVTAGGTAYCWGDNGPGKLGAGTTTGTAAPITVAGGLTFAAVSAGYAHTCGVTTGGAGYCWGDNQAGELGNGTLTQSNVPAAVSGALTFASITTGRFVTCGLTTSGAGYCWGDNSFGEVGDGTLVTRTSPVAVSGGRTFAMISAGGFHSCGLTTSGTVYCWGGNVFGELGNGTTTDSPTPVLVAGGLTFVTVSAGNRHNCGVTTTGDSYCWGDNSVGHLGDGTTTNSSTPVRVAGGLTFANVIAGRFHTCGLTTVNTAYCWGGNSSGQVGDGTVVDKLMPVRVR